MLLGYSIGLLLCCGVFALGKQMIAKPEMLARIFSWAPRFAMAYSRIAGRFFFVMGIIGMVFYLVLLIRLAVRHI